MLFDSPRISIANPETPQLVATSGFEAERVTSMVADWDDAPDAYQARTTKLVLHREALDLASHRAARAAPSAAGPGRAES